MTRPEFITFLGRCETEKPRPFLTPDESDTLLMMFDAGAIDPKMLPLPPAEAIPTQAQIKDRLEALRPDLPIAVSDRPDDAQEAFEAQARALAEVMEQSGDIRAWHEAMMNLTVDMNLIQALSGGANAVRR